MLLCRSALITLPEQAPGTSLPSRRTGPLFFYPAPDLRGPGTRLSTIFGGLTHVSVQPTGSSVRTAGFPALAAPRLASWQTTDFSRRHQRSRDRRWGSRHPWRTGANHRRRDRGVEIYGDLE